MEQCAAPDVYRGAHRGADAGARYAESVEAACASLEARGSGVCAMFVESGMSVAGVLLPPLTYLARCFAAVRARGGVCVCDEVQTGFGRFGRDAWWGFEAAAAGDAAAHPDIVTMGKCMGNGMPLAAVVCTGAVSDAFAGGPECVTDRADSTLSTAPLL